MMQLQGAVEIVEKINNEASFLISVIGLYLFANLTFEFTFLNISSSLNA